MNGRTGSVAILLLATGLVASLAAPLLTYSLGLALFGLPHVLVEFRYVDERFGLRMRAGSFLPWCFAMLVLLVGSKAVGASGFRVAGASELELLVLVPMVLAAGFVARSAGVLRPLAVVTALAITAACVALALTDPLAGLLAFACLHNLSPLLLIGERLGRGAVVRWVPAFLLVPALIVCGVPEFVVDLPEPAAAWHGMSRESLLAAFVPASWSGQLALDWFRACVFLQCAHYVFVLWVLPRLGAGAHSDPLLGWPRPRTFGLLVVGASLLGAVGFAFDFGSARAHYAIPAAVHAWIEVPLLVLGLSRSDSWASRPGSRSSYSPS